MYAERTTRADVRLSNVFKIAQRRLQAGLDIYNLLNANAPQTINTTFGPDWRKPTEVLGPRLLKLSAQLDF